MGATLAAVRRFLTAEASHCRAEALGAQVSVVVALGLRCSKACGIFLDQRLNLCPIAALFVTARTWKQSRCSLVDEWMKKMYIYVYTMEYDSAILFLNEVMLFAAIWMDLEIIILSEVSQRKINIL